ncbi:hypothetical protein [Burkholderia anthina]|uniref:hypothetical protein n=1 Tax=Burkholderia anthina TaxID=179879 RepID=UPI00158BAD47|nr:hypothetical protein [Burkholderia anthina]
MSDVPNRAGMCEAYGCPLFATVAPGGKWVCFVHANCRGANDAVTSVLKAHMPIVHAILDTRRFCFTSEWDTAKKGIARALREFERADLLPGPQDATSESGQPEPRKWLMRIERELLALTADVGVQASFPTTVPSVPIPVPTRAASFHPYGDEVPQ